MVEFLKRRTKMRLKARSFGLGFLLSTLPLLVSGQAQHQDSSPPNLPAASDVVQFLSKTIYWYQQTRADQQLVSEPTDLAYADNNQRMAGQIVSLAFESARQTAQLIEKDSKSAPTQNGSLSTTSGLAQAAASIDQQLKQTQAELQSLQQQREKAVGKKRQQLDAQIGEVQSEIGLMQARAAALRSMTVFVSGASTGRLGAAGLQGQIEELARSVPADLSQPQEKNNPQAAASSSAKNAALIKQPPSGIWGLTDDIFHLSLKSRTLKREIAAADSLLQTIDQLRAPLLANIRQMIQSGNQLAVQADTSDINALNQERQQLDNLTAQFKAIAAAAIPLGQQVVVLGLYKQNLANWEESVSGNYVVDIKNLVFRLVFLAILIGVVLGLGELWRRTIVRYVQDMRRRYQLLLVRRIVLWIAIGIVLVFTFSTELGSMVTFAGLITAGIAVALQNVIVSIVGYFFLIGKYGIRVGDRVQAGGVTGSVIDIGLVRFHVMEIDPGSPDAQPTGRVVAFSNSIVFQATPGLFKQIPGTSFIWHEIKLTFAVDSDHKAARERIGKAVDTALADYRENLERQQQQMEKSLASIPASELKPRIRSHFTPAGQEFLIRYPVVLQKAQEIDERLMAAVSSELAEEPKLALIASEPGKVVA